jgi:CRISPR-associated protein Csb2
MTYLVITVRWLDGRYHGLLDKDGPPEWPPSPLRLFQALVSGVARRGELDATLGKSLEWLQTLEPPEIVAPRVHPGQVVAHFVPNNDGDKKPDRQDRLKGKTFRPTLMIDPAEIHYLWPIAPESALEAQFVCQAARYLTCLGWGIDAAYSDGCLVESEEAARLFGIRWRARKGVSHDSGLLRVPVFDQETGRNTLDDLKRVHASSLRRIEHGKPFNPVEKLKVFDRVFYESKDRLPARSFAAFSILKLDASGFRAFDTPRQSLTVAGMMRHLTKIAAGKSGWPESKIGTFILGHAGSNNPGELVSVESKRFAYLPLPSIEGRGEGKVRVVGNIRRVMISSFADNCEDEISWARRALSAQDLVDEDQKRAVALLSLVPSTDKAVRCCTQSSVQWATVTPVVLPGYDDPAHYRRRLKRGTEADEQKNLLDKLYGRTDALLRKSITQAGLSQELADHAHLEWRKAGFWPGAELTDRYGVPKHLKRFPRVHVRIQWRDAQDKPVSIPGPICLGGGRFYGLGLFAAEK